MRPIHEPIFLDVGGLYIIWCRPKDERHYTIAAGPLSAMMAAWDVLYDIHPKQDEITLKQGARVIRKREAEPDEAPVRQGT